MSLEVDTTAPFAHPPACLPDGKPVGAEQYVSAVNPKIKFHHGTTTLAFIFKEGVLLAVDSRASMGSYIASGTVQKVVKISRYLLGTIAGGAADCSFWERQLALQCRIHELREGKRISVAAASKRLCNMVYQYRNRGLSMGTMLAGWDEVTGPALYYIDDDGTRLKGDLFSVGSGSTYAYGVLDNEYRFDMTLEEAVELGKRAIYHATHRDAYSGGTINVFAITKDGWRQYYRGDMNELHYGEYLEEKLRDELKREGPAVMYAKVAAAKAENPSSTIDLSRRDTGPSVPLPTSWTDPEEQAE